MAEQESSSTPSQSQPVAVAVSVPVSSAYSLPSWDTRSTRLSGILFEGLFSDLEIFCSPSLFPNTTNTSTNTSPTPLLAHCALVASQSPILRSLIDSSTSTSTTNTLRTAINLPNIQRHTMEQVLTYLYKGTVSISDKELVRLYDVACLLQLPQLKTLCEQHVSCSLSLHSVLFLYQTSLAMEAPELEQSCIRFFKLNFTQIADLYLNPTPNSQPLLEHQSLAHLSELSLIKLLCLNFYCREMHLFRFVVEWGRVHQRAEKTRTLPQILAKVIRYVRLISISRQDLETSVLPLLVVPFRLMADTLFAKLTNRYAVQEGRHTEDRNARDQDGGPLRFYLRPRENNWLRLGDFEHEGQYAEYCKSVLREGMGLRAVNDYENVQRGDLGEFVQHNSGYPPCQVRWEAYANTYWLYWRDLEIVGSEVDIGVGTPGEIQGTQ